jgi:GTP diphosphokinase / guanosine-3',5'-bis(diphosphate) 3'-diphosphatase
MSTLERAIAIAAAAHAGQVDKAGTPYILHPLRVMLAQTSNDAGSSPSCTMFSVTPT